MHACHRAHAVLNLLEQKQERIANDKVKIEHRLADVEQQIERCQQDVDAINRKINATLAPGVINRGAIYRGIRQQSVLLFQQQDIFQRMIDLKHTRAEAQQRLQQCRDALTQLDKRHYKISFYLRRVRRELFRQADIRAENEIQEVTGYGGKNNAINKANIVDT